MDTIRKKSTINWPSEFHYMYKDMVEEVPDMGIMNEGAIYQFDGIYIFPDGSTWDEKDGSKTFEDFRKEKIKEHGENQKEKTNSKKSTSKNNKKTNEFENVEYILKENHGGKYAMKVINSIEHNLFQRLKTRMKKLGGVYYTGVGFVFSEKPDLTPIIGEPTKNDKEEIKRVRKKKEKEEKEAHDNFKKRLNSDTYEYLYDIFYDPFRSHKPFKGQTFKEPSIVDIGKFETNEPVGEFSFRDKWGVKLTNKFEHPEKRKSWRFVKIGKKKGYITFENKERLKEFLRNTNYMILPSSISELYRDRPIIDAIASNSHQSEVFQRYLDEF